LTGVGLDAFVFAINDVRPSLIRVDADEATYNLHILLRFELERALIDGELSVADLPAAWADGMERFLGSSRLTTRRGACRTFIGAGELRILPTYTLGNLYAAQFFTKAQAELGDLEEQFRRGEFLPLKDWLNRKIHREGQRYRAADLVAAVTGEPLNPSYLLRHLREKLGALYDYDCCAIRRRGGTGAVRTRDVRAHRRYRRRHRMTPGREVGRQAKVRQDRGERDAACIVQGDARALSSRGYLGRRSPGMWTGPVPGMGRAVLTYEVSLVHLRRNVPGGMNHDGSSARMNRPFISSGPGFAFAKPAPDRIPAGFPPTG